VFSLAYSTLLPDLPEGESGLLAASPVRGRRNTQKLAQQP
jgi:hypothetical protein